MLLSQMLEAFSWCQKVEQRYEYISNCHGLALFEDSKTFFTNTRKRG